MFQIGDKVVHNEFGICRVTGISCRKFPGQEQQDYYEISPLSDDGYGTRLYVSVNKNDRLREPMTREQILETIDAMPQTDPLVLPSTGNRVLDMENAKAAYKSLLHSGDPRDRVILLRTIHQKSEKLSAQKKKIAEFEVNARNNSEHLLYGEIAAVMDIPAKDVEKFITERIEG